jgi:hypothetical protein
LEHKTRILPSRVVIGSDTLSEAARFGIEATRPDDYLGSADAFIDRALRFYRDR